MTEKEKHIELEYIQKSQKDRKFFSYLYEKYYEQIFVFIYKKIQDESVCGEVCSRIFLKAITHIDKYEDRGFPFSSWLYRIASNEVNQFFRSQKKNIWVQVDENSVASIASELEIEEDEKQLERILRAMEELPQEKSALIELRFFEDRSFKEIASIFAISEASAKMKVYRIIESIKKSLLKGTKK